MTGTPKVRAARERSEVTSECNECNEALNAARAAITAARRLALVAENALVNGDLRRARAALQNLHDTTTKGATLDAAPTLGQR